ncbi:hypothetical protein A7U43_21565 [Mycobacterium adipatum]|uniref:DUF2993 domain-containing protein n=1 Tax=Mycobacterium adipatum TaxID=1682113 RepID=A0A172UR49_9MYCO|nr:DUF2993 domain-containing protein [Mycobacterium adipatum]ANE81535.1 hypothetical protein A7U43_21565 [Mycobacterium adipatum]MBI5735436.1 DUF2993 domain-containing protein [Mycolicibacterium neoaurum]
MPTQPPEPPRDPATRRIPRPPRPEPPTQRLPRPEPPTQKIRVPDPVTQQIRTPPPPQPPPPPPLAAPGMSPPPPPAARTKPRNKQSIALIAVIVVAVLVGGLAAAELYARHRAGTVLSGITDCLVEDTAEVSYSVTPPFLWQYLTDHYSDISVITTGDRVEEAKGMTADVTLSDIDLRPTADAKGTIGSVSATLDWTADGIKQTVAENLPVVGDLVTGVRTDAAAGTLILDATGGTTITARPEVDAGNLQLNVVDVTGPFGRDAVQTALNELTTTLNDNYPLGIKADSVAVTSTGVTGKFSSTDAAIPTGESDSCFEAL